MSFSEKITTLELLISILKQNETQLETLIEKMEIIDKTFNQNPILTDKVNVLNSSYTDELGLVKILIVEYDRDLATTFKLILENVGYTVDVASTGLQALYRVKQRSYNLLLVDLNLPDCSSDKVVEMIEKDNDVEIVYITGGYGIENEKICDREVLLKPVDADNLLEVTSRRISL
jgi:CheY-like chemotaxis protein